jgi:predicted nucleotidyltransferase
MQNTQEILDTILLSKQHLSAAFTLRTVGVFGSVIRGEQRDGSDIDVLVDLDSKADLLDLIRIGQYLGVCRTYGTRPIAIT